MKLARPFLQSPKARWSYLVVAMLIAFEPSCFTLTDDNVAARWLIQIGFIFINARAMSCVLSKEVRQDFSDWLAKSTRELESRHAEVMAIYRTEQRRRDDGEGWKHGR